MRSYYLVTFLVAFLATGCKPNISVPANGDIARQQAKEVLSAAKPEVAKTHNADVTDELAKAALTRLKQDCRRQDYQEFFDDFVRFKPVRDRYTSTRIDEQPNKTAKPFASLGKPAVTDRFKIALVDDLYVTSASRDQAPALAAAYDRLEVIPKLVDDETFRVDYAQAHFGDTDDGGEQVADIYGMKGRYVFKFQNGCWYLTEDLRR